MQPALKTFYALLYTPDCWCAQTARNDGDITRTTGSEDWLATAAASYGTAIKQRTEKQYSQPATNTIS